MVFGTLFVALARTTRSGCELGKKGGLVNGSANRGPVIEVKTIRADSAAHANSEISEAKQTLRAIIVGQTLLAGVRDVVANPSVIVIQTVLVGGTLDALFMAHQAGRGQGCHGITILVHVAPIDADSGVVTQSASVNRAITIVVVSAL